MIQLLFVQIYPRIFSGACVHDCLMLERSFVRDWYMPSSSSAQSAFTAPEFDLRSYSNGTPLIGRWHEVVILSGGWIFYGVVCGCTSNVARAVSTSDTRSWVRDYFPVFATHWPLLGCSGRESHFDHNDESNNLPYISKSRGEITWMFNQKITISANERKNKNGNQFSYISILFLWSKLIARGRPSLLSISIPNVRPI